jgi:hypothetical protein
MEVIIPLFAKRQTLVQKWGVVDKLKSLWGLKNEISSLYFSDFTMVKVISL